MSETPLLSQVTHLFRSLGITDRPFSTTEQLQTHGSSIVVALYEAVMAIRLDGIERKPTVDAQYVSNADLVLDNLRRILPAHIVIPAGVTGTTIHGGGIAALHFFVTLLSDMAALLHQNSMLPTTTPRASGARQPSAAASSSATTSGVLSSSQKGSSRPTTPALAQSLAPIASPLTGSIPPSRRRTLSSGSGAGIVGASLSGGGGGGGAKKKKSLGIGPKQTVGSPSKKTSPSTASVSPSPGHLLASDGMIASAGSLGISSPPSSSPSMSSYPVASSGLRGSREGEGRPTTAPNSLVKSLLSKTSFAPASASASSSQSSSAATASAASLSSSIAQHRPSTATGARSSLSALVKTSSSIAISRKTIHAVAVGKTRDRPSSSSSSSTTSARTAVTPRLVAQQSHTTLGGTRPSTAPPLAQTRSASSLVSDLAQTRSASSSSFVSEDHSDGPSMSRGAGDTGAETIGTTRETPRQALRPNVPTVYDSSTNMPPPPPSSSEAFAPQETAASAAERRILTNMRAANDAQMLHLRKLYESTIKNRLADWRRIEGSALKSAMLRARAAKHERRTIAARTKKVCEDMARQTLSLRLARSSKQAAATSSLLNAYAAQLRGSAADQLRALSGTISKDLDYAQSSVAAAAHSVAIAAEVAREETAKQVAQRAAALRSQKEALSRAMRDMRINEDQLLTTVKMQQAAAEGAFTASHIDPLSLSEMRGGGGADAAALLEHQASARHAAAPDLAAAAVDKSIGKYARLFAARAEETGKLLQLAAREAADAEQSAEKLHGAPPPTASNI